MSAGEANATSPGEYRARRKALLDRVDGPVLVRAAGLRGFNRNFAYLTGLSEPRAALLMAPDGLRIGTGRAHPGRDYVRGRTVREVLFLPGSDPMAERWGEAPQATCERADPDTLGVEAIAAEAQIDAVVSGVLARAERLHYVRATPATLAGADDGDTRFVDRIRRRFFAVDLQDATSLVHELRRLKSPSEVRAIESAGKVVARAFERLLPAVRAGRHEHEIEAEIAHVYRAAGAGHAFDPIVACGKNATILHYVSNSDRLDAGSLLLVDTGAHLDGYASDVTRTVPVDGRFNDRQREVYDRVLAAQRAAIDACRPGATLSDVHVTAYDVLDRAGLGDAFVHGTSHHLGLEVHDPADPHAPFEPGVIVTVEPGAYLADEALGIRIEDDVLVEAGGPRVLTDGIPKSVDEIERAMAG